MKFVHFALLMLALLALGCKKGPESIVGNWELRPSDAWIQKSKTDGNAPPAGEFTFNADGTCHLARAADGGRMDIAGTYKVTGSKVEFYQKEINGQLSPDPKGSLIVGTLSDDRMTLYINNLDFVRQE